MGVAPLTNKLNNLFPEYLLLIPTNFASAGLKVLLSEGGMFLPGDSIKDICIGLEVNIAIWPLQVLITLK